MGRQRTMMVVIIWKWNHLFTQQQEKLTFLQGPLELLLIIPQQLEEMVRLENQTLALAAEVDFHIIPLLELVALEEVDIWRLYGRNN